MRKASSALLNAESAGTKIVRPSVAATAGSRSHALTSSSIAHVLLLVDDESEVSRHRSATALTIAVCVDGVVRAALAKSEPAKSESKKSIAVPDFISEREERYTHTVSLCFLFSVAFASASFAHTTYVLSIHTHTHTHTRTTTMQLPPLLSYPSIVSWLVRVRQRTAGHSIHSGDLGCDDKCPTRF